MQTLALILVIPEKTDPERDQVAACWEAAGGTVTRVGRFWDPPSLDPASVRIYANDTFALVLAQQLNLHLVSPDDDLLVRLPSAAIGRRLGILSLADTRSLAYPTFLKPVIPKQFLAKVYESLAELEEQCAGLEQDALIYESEIVMFEAEARGFILNGQIQDVSIYEGHGSISEAWDFLASVATNSALPNACVLDAGYITGRGWVVIEANAAWGAGLNGCDPDKVLDCIAHATRYDMPRVSASARHD